MIYITLGWWQIHNKIKLNDITESTLKILTHNHLWSNHFGVGLSHSCRQVQSGWRVHSQWDPSNMWLVLPHHTAFTANTPHLICDQVSDYAFTDYITLHNITQLDKHSDRAHSVSNGYFSERKSRVAKLIRPLEFTHA